MMSENIKQLLPFLKRIANQLYGYYGGPVYLVGSALTDENPRDIDIKVVVSRKDFERLFGNYDHFAVEYSTGEFGDVAWKWVDDRLKRCRILSEEIGQNIDFGCYSEEMWRTDFPYLRIDTRQEYDDKKNLK